MNIFASRTWRGFWYIFLLPHSRALRIPLIMSSSSSLVLQEFIQLDRSSQDFPEKLCDLLYGEDYRQRAPGLQDEDLMWLVEYLDQVWHHTTLPHPRFQLG